MDEINNRVNLKLTTIGEPAENIKPFLFDYLLKIESYLYDAEIALNDAVQVLKLRNISASSLSKHLGISRTTLYNHNQLLKRYIEASEHELVLSNPIYQIEAKKAKIDQMKAEIEGLYDRDINLEIQNHKIVELVNALKDKDKEIMRLETRNREISRELHEFKKNNETKKGMLSSITDKSKI